LGEQHQRQVGLGGEEKKSDKERFQDLGEKARTKWVKMGGLIAEKWAWVEPLLRKFWVEVSFPSTRGEGKKRPCLRSREPVCQGQGDLTKTKGKKKYCR